MAGDRMEVIDEEHALAQMLECGVLFANERTFRGFDGKDVSTVVLFVLCNDVFCPGADAEPIAYDEILPLYEAWDKHDEWGPVMWCVKKRKQRPQPRMVECMKHAGVWDEEMKAIP